MRFQNQVVVITGAGSGMGRAYALAFARLGAKLALCDVDVPGLDQTVAMAHGLASGLEILAQKVDVSSWESMQAFASESFDTLGPAYIVINNAGIEGCQKPIAEMAHAELARVMSINFWGVVHGTKAFLPQLQQRNTGAIVNISSVFGLIGTPNGADYSAAKFAVSGYTEALMTELAHSQIQVHLVHPGGIATNISRSETSREFRDKYLRTDPDEFVQYVIRCLHKNTPRIVYGYMSLPIWLGAKFVPTKLRTKIIAGQVGKVQGQ